MNKQIVSDLEFMCSPKIKATKFTPLMLAVLTGSDIKPFLKSDINAKNSSGWTALMIACRNSCTWSSLGTVRMLLDAGADVNIQHNNRWTALMMAARYTNKGSSEETVKMLLEAGADMNVEEKDGWTALMLATRYSNNDSSEKVVKMLLDTGASINIQNNMGITALMMAAQNSKQNEDSSEKTVKILLEAGADVNMYDNNGNTALTLAINNCDKKMTKMLIMASADIEACEGKLEDAEMVELKNYRKESLLVERNKELENKIVELENKIVELECRPPRIYEEAKEHFYDLANDLIHT